MSCHHKHLRFIFCFSIHMGKAEYWSRRLSKVFPMVIAHHRKSPILPNGCPSVVLCSANSPKTSFLPLGANNILLLSETKYCDALRAYLMVVTKIYTPITTQQSHEYRDKSSVGFLERACFGLTAFVMQCELRQPFRCARAWADQFLTSVTVGNAKTIESIFGGAWTEGGSPDFMADLFSKLRPGAMAPLSSISNGGALAETLENSIRHTAGFLVQIKLHLKLHFEAARGPLSLLPPSIPPMNAASQYDGPYELGSAAILWPWLRDGLAGTPLAGLSPASGHRWAGYYTYEDILETHDPPMFFKLRLAPPTPAAEAAYKVYFCGEGADNVGSFTLEGSSDTQTGVVIARKVYAGAHWWDWYGVITPFGMVGVWGTGSNAFGWWWIWPQEWSERSTAPATVTN